MKKTTIKSAAITAIIIFLLLLWIFLIHTAIDAADPSTEDPADYPSVLQSLQHPGTSALVLFPDKIPKSAEEVCFSYDSDLGGQALCLKYQMNIESIKVYQRAAAQRAIWTGTPTQEDAKSMGVYESSFAVFNYVENGFPSDLTIYLIYQKPYRENDWNHGEISLVGISLDSCEVLFVFKHW